MDSEKLTTNREDFRNYLQETGIIDTLNNFLVKLYRTSDKVDFFPTNFFTGM